MTCEKNHGERAKQPEYYRREPEQEHRWKAGAREFQPSPEGSKDIVGARQVIHRQELKLGRGYRSEGSGDGRQWGQFRAVSYFLFSVSFLFVCLFV